MSIIISGEELIYSGKTKKYFHEVKSSYAIGNYRSATVMLYSLVIFDLYNKLDELYHSYNDNKSKEIIGKVNDARLNGKDVSRSQWEKELLDLMKKETEFLDDVSYDYIMRLRNDRNFAAHPLFNDTHELVAPTPEVTIAHIKNMLDLVLTKPPIFINNIYHTLLDDLKDKKDIYEKDKESLENYLCSKYFNRMPENMKKFTYIKLWLFCFNKPDNEEILENININCLALEILGNKLNINEVINEDINAFTVSTNTENIEKLILYLSSNSSIYNMLPKATRDIVEDKIINCDSSKIYSWFKFSEVDEHKKFLLEQTLNNYSTKSIQKMLIYYKKLGKLHELIDCLIHLCKCSESFNQSDMLFDIFIIDLLDCFSDEQLINLIRTVESNDQIFYRNKAYEVNTLIVKECMKRKKLNYDFEILTTFSFDRRVLEEQ